MTSTTKKGSGLPAVEVKVLEGERSALSTNIKLDYWGEVELGGKIGFEKKLWAVALAKELGDNSLDALARSRTVNPKVIVTLTANLLRVEDNAKGGITAEDVRATFDYYERLSINRHFVLPTRGRLGNALKCIYAAPYVCTGSGSIEIETLGTKFIIASDPEPLKQGTSLKCEEEHSDRTEGTSITLRWKGIGETDSAYLHQDMPLSASIAMLVKDFAAFNPNVSFETKVLGETWSGSALNPEWEKWSTNGAGSPYWYSVLKLKALIEAHIDNEKDSIRGFLGLFIGLHTVKRVDAVLEEAGIPGAKSLDAFRHGKGDFTDNTKCLLAAMQRVSADSKVSPKDLGILGEPNMKLALANRETNEYTEHHGYDALKDGDMPYIVEACFAEQLEGRGYWDVSVSLNHSPALKLPSGLQEVMEKAGLKSTDSVVLILNLVCPDFLTVDYSKTTTLVLTAKQKESVKKVVKKVSEDFKNKRYQTDESDVDVTLLREGDWKHILADFTDDELRSLRVPKEGRRGQTNEEKLLDAKRIKAVVKLFLEITKPPSKPQTKRHAYYICKAISLCGADHGNDGDNAEKVAKIIRQACWTGAIDWRRVKGSRILNTQMFWADAATFIKGAVPQFAVDLGIGQRKRLIVCTEKDAMIDSVHDVCEAEQIPSMSFHGQSADDSVHTLADHIHGWKGTCEEVVIAYFGDHDPAGLTIDEIVFTKSADYKEGKLKHMLNKFFLGSPTVSYERLGMTLEDITSGTYEQYAMDLPDMTKLNPAEKKKQKTYRASGATKVLGLDVMSTEHIEGRLQEFVNRHKDATARAERVAFLGTERAKLAALVDGAGKIEPGAPPQHYVVTDPEELKRHIAEVNEAEDAAKEEREKTEDIVWEGKARGRMEALPTAEGKEVLTFCIGEQKFFTVKPKQIAMLKPFVCMPPDYVEPDTVRLIMHRSDMNAEYFEQASTDSFQLSGTRLTRAKKGIFRAQSIAWKGALTVTYNGKAFPDDPEDDTVKLAFSVGDKRFATCSQYNMDELLPLVGKTVVFTMEESAKAFKSFMEPQGEEDFYIEKLVLNPCAWYGDEGDVEATFNLWSWDVERDFAEETPVAE